MQVWGDSVFYFLKKVFLYLQYNFDLADDNMRQLESEGIINPVTYLLETQCWKSRLRWVSRWATLLHQPSPTEKWIKWSQDKMSLLSTHYCHFCKLVLNFRFRVCRIIQHGPFTWSLSSSINKAYISIRPSKTSKKKKNSWILIDFHWVVVSFF